MSTMRFALFGAGFWSAYQLAAWQELGGVECVAICDVDRARADALAARFGVPAAYDDPETLLARETPGFVDIVTGVDSHRPLTLLAARHGVPVICQKPLAPSLDEAREMAQACRTANVPLLVHENWRWQAPLREARRVLDAGTIGTPFRARIELVSGFTPWVNQPALRELEQFILTDIGTHILDVARFLFGEAERLGCETHRTLPELRGENVATVTLRMNGGQTTVVCAMAYAATPLERECFPETLVFIEGNRGSLEIAPGCSVRTTTADGTHAHRVRPPRYGWANPDYDLIHASMVPCLGNLLGRLRGDAPAETTAEDNLRTLELVFGAYESARTGQAVPLPLPDR